MGNKRKYRPGVQVGKRTIIKMSKDRGRVVLKCECGDIREVNMTYVYQLAVKDRKGEYTHCYSCHPGHKKKRETHMRRLEEKYLGETIGDLTIIDLFRDRSYQEEWNEKSPQSVLYFLVLCNCGEVGVKCAQHVYDEAVTSCHNCSWKKHWSYNEGDLINGWKIVERKVGENAIGYECISCGKQKKVTSPVKLATKADCRRCLGKVFKVHGEWHNMSSLGKKFGYTRERVRQLMNRMGPEEVYEFLKKRSKDK